ncbi:MAG: glycosyltransferase [Candidatus Saccharibacteria bacterium]|nr:glycosyltransferase [Microbacteriaceae bacterium]
MGIQTSLDAVLQADRLVDSMRLADELAFEASRDGGPRTVRVLTSALNSEDQVAAIAATHALAQIFDEQADIALSRLLSSSRGFMREHAAWALSLRLPRFDTVGRLIGLVSQGGFGGMLAQRTLEQWGSPVAEHVAIGLESALLGIDEPGARYRLVETLGLVRKSVATPALLRIAADILEEETVRVAAVSALGQRRGDREIVAVLDNLARSEGYLADVARLSLVDLEPESTRVRDSSHGLTIAQLFLHADLDAGLTLAGSGDNGGIATLLVRLGDALVAGENASPRVDRVITLSRGSVADALQSVVDIGAGEWGHDYGRVPLLSEPVQSASAWPLRVAARRGIRRMLRAAGGVDLLHLRMADVGSLAAADAARDPAIPVVFTVAPDPHAVIHSLDLSGRLTRQNFGEIDEVEHFWFRTHLVQQLAANAAHTVLFPRPSLERDMRELVGIDITAHPERHSTVPEGIDLEVVDRAAIEGANHAAGQPATPALEELRDLLVKLPEHRRTLPLLVSVGRFHRVKGMATIVDAWANGSLADRANLLLIGGNLVDPSADEREQLELMDAIISPESRFEAGLVLSGHRRNDTVARWVAAARFGVPGLAAPRGIYVCGSLKEEFGIALLEAMGSGLLVVAPDGGGPATYVEEGVTGFLAPTWDVVPLRCAMTKALGASLAEDTADRAAASRATVEVSYTIQAMARALSNVYQGVQDEESESRGWSFAAL